MVDSANGRSVPIARTLSGTAAALALAIGVCSPALSQTTEPVTKPENKAQIGPALWQITDEDTTIYLYGFTQALPPGTKWRNAAFDRAFDSADLIVLETLTPSPEEQAEMQQTIQSVGIYTGGKTLSSLLDPAELKLVSSVARGLGVPLQGIDPLKPWLASIQLGVIAVTRKGFDVANPPSSSIEADARIAGKTLEAFEQPTDLLIRIAELPEAEHVGMLVHAAKELRDNPDQFKQVNAAWLDGNVSQIGVLLHGPSGTWSSDVVYDAMLVSRNANFVQKITQLMADHEGTVLVAIGLGHLAGKDSLVTMLEHQGFSVKRQ